MQKNTLKPIWTSPWEGPFLLGDKVRCNSPDGGGALGAQKSRLPHQNHGDYFELLYFVTFAVLN